MTNLAARESLHPKDGERNILKIATALFKDSERTREQLFKAQKEELDYTLRFKHFKYDRGNTKDMTRIQPHGPELFDLVRYETSSICSIPPFIECRPQHEFFDDPQLAEDGKKVIEAAVLNPVYSKLRRRWVAGSLAARSWVMAIECVYGVGPFKKQVAFRLVAPWNFGWADGWQDMHDPTCPWVYEKAHMRLGDVLARGKSVAGEETWNVSGLSADSGKARSDQSENPTTGMSEQDVVTIVKMWFRFDGETEDVVTRYDLAPAEQYGECPMCGNVDPNFPRDETGQVDMQALMMCPDCQAAPLLPVRQNDRIDTFAAFPDGRLVIFAPEHNKKLYDGPWPEKLRSFPYMYGRCYEDPVNQTGQSETSVHWPSQTIINGIRRLGWEQMRRNVDITILLENAFKDANGQPFKITDMPGQVAWARDVAALNGAKHFPGTGIPRDLPAFHQLMIEQFRQAAGTQQFKFTEEQSKNIPVGTAEILSRSGSVPERDKVAMFQEEESIGFGVVLDMTCQVWGAEEARRYLGPDGEKRLERLRQASLTSLEVVVSGSPQLASIRRDEVEAFSALADLRPSRRKIVARMLNIPASLMRELEEEERKELEQAGIIPPEGGPGGGIALPTGPAGAIAPPPGGLGAPPPAPALAGKAGGMMG